MCLAAPQKMFARALVDNAALALAVDEIGPRIAHGYSYSLVRSEGDGQESRLRSTEERGVQELNPPRPRPRLCDPFRCGLVQQSLEQPQYSPGGLFRVASAVTQCREGALPASDQERIFVEGAALLRACCSKAFDANGASDSLHR